MAEKSVVITYETLFELLNRERERPELQKLEQSFFADVVDYLREKSKYTEEVKNSSSASFDEKMKAEKQLHNLHKIIKEIYERREKKILFVALDRSRTKSNIIDTSSLLTDERTMFDTLTRTLDSFRKGILENVISLNAPSSVQERPAEPKKEVQKENPPFFQNAAEIAGATKLVRFVHAVPKFVGTELEEYGPFQEEDVANLPSEIAELLVSKGRVEEIKQS